MEVLEHQVPPTPALSGSSEFKPGDYGFEIDRCFEPWSRWRESLYYESGGYVMM